MHRNAPSRIIVVMASAILAPLPASAADNPGAHQHGHAELQIAIDTNSADVFLRSPAYNLLGFEHQPRTKQQHQQLKKFSLAFFCHSSDLVERGSRLPSFYLQSDD